MLRSKNALHWTLPGPNVVRSQGTYLFTPEKQVSFQRAFSGARWEEHIGYCRALRAGNRIFVTGTAAVNPDGSVHAPGDAYAQSLRCFEIIREALREVGADLPDVTRTRMFVTDIDLWAEYGRAHRETFGEHPPTTSMVEIRRLIHPDMLIEIEADAVLTDDPR